ncbi:hypothetical protein MW887_000180 [Aspergillus wentii]|nr:hypothetical protein MW887_000180 [Aspergillus wentii]
MFTTPTIPIHDDHFIVTVRAAPVDGHAQTAKSCIAIFGWCGAAAAAQASILGRFLAFYVLYNSHLRDVIPLQTSTEDNTYSSSSLSSSAKAGFGVGVAAATAVSIIARAVFFFCRRKRHSPGIGFQGHNTSTVEAQSI